MSKQRLIDADALKDNMFHYAAPEMVWDRGDIEHKINEMPTIDAIPVEWIEDRLAKMLKGKACGFVECATIQALLVSWENHKIHLQAKIEREAK